MAIKLSLPFWLAVLVMVTQIDGDTWPQILHSKCSQWGNDPHQGTVPFKKMSPRNEPVVATYWHLVNSVGQKESAKSKRVEQGAFVHKLSSRQGDWLCHLADILVTLLAFARRGQ
jgi:hypothetical protein